MILSWLPSQGGWDDSYNPDGYDWETWMLANADWFDWLGTDATYELSGFVDPVVNHGGNSWIDGSFLFVDGVMTIPGIDPDSGLIAALLVVRADPGLEVGTYTIEVELIPVTA